MTAHRRTTLALVATAALIIPAAPAGAATVSDPLLDGQITPLGLAVDDGELLVANAFAGFLTRDGAPIASIPGQEGGALTGVAVAEDGAVAYTASVIPELDPSPGDPPTTYLYLLGQDDPVADLGAYESSVNPDQGQEYGFLDVSASCLEKLAHKVGPMGLPYYGVVDSNPYAVASDGDGGWYVADAAANAILHVERTGDISTTAVLPPVPQVFPSELRKDLRVPRIEGMPNPERVKVPRCAAGQTFYGEPVPTDVEVGPEGDLYVSLLPGFPEMGGRAVRIDPVTGEVEETLATGLAGAVDLAVQDDGTVWVAELFGNRVSAWQGGSMVDEAFVLLPGAVEVAEDTVYATYGALIEEPPFGGVVTIS
jgi:streptogramin lyase